MYRELRFITEFGKKELLEVVKDIDDDSLVVLQGVADCVFIEDGKAVIIDYKTDRVKSMDELMEKYEKQVKLYKEILKHTLELEVSQCILYSFWLSEWRSDPI